MTVDHYVYMSVTSLFFLWCLPVRLYKYKSILSFITLMVLLRFDANFWLTAVLTELAIIFSMFVVLKLIKEEIISGYRISLFLVIVIIDQLISGINVFFYFYDIGTYVKWFLPLSVFNISIYAINIVYGPGKKIEVPSFIRKFLTVSNLENNKFETENGDSSTTFQAYPIIESLTKREKEILELVKQGYTNKEIAEKEHVGVTTIESHLRNIKEKLGFKKMHELRKHIKNLQ